MSRLSQLAASLPTIARVGDADPEVQRIVYDSRAVGAGDLFAALPGQKTDGTRFVADAVARGAAAVLLEEDRAGEVLPLPVPVLLAANARVALAHAAAALYGYPSREMTLVGVTGTNGKTTTTYLVEAILKAAGHRTGVIGTLGARIGDRALPGDRTTPEAPDLQALFATMVQEGVTGAAMEVSSHALVQDRTLATEFDVAVFTNLTQDHLDYHETLEAYFDAKAILFRDYPGYTRKPFAAVINRDDPWGRRLAEELRDGATGRRGDGARVLTYGIEDGDVDLRATNIHATPAGVSFELSMTSADGVPRPVAPSPRRPVSLQLGGYFNCMNALAAAGVGVALGIPGETIRAALEAVPGVPGRFEAVRAGQSFSVIVDYAHTPDGLLNVLSAARALDPKRLLVVFGCGGDRDRAKRPQMGALAARLADVAFVTSDNPRSEEPAAIIRDILAGIEEERERRAQVRVEPDRRAAIHAALAEAEPGDLVLIAGKGHEDYQIFADRTVHFDDREVAHEYLKGALGSGL
jgi:UDP-N-acetylmuramoyl-L-alanyl-D-glutamate--2,6-diaminopimelate ligase